MRHGVALKDDTGLELGDALPAPGVETPQCEAKEVLPALRRVIHELELVKAPPIQRDLEGPRADLNPSNIAEEP